MDLVLVVDGDKYSAAGMSIKSLATLLERVSWILDLLDLRDSHCKCSNMDETLLVFLKRFAHGISCSSSLDHLKLP